VSIKPHGEQRADRNARRPGDPVRRKRGEWESDRAQPGPLSMKLSRTVAYAVQATLQLAQAKSDAPVPCSRLAAEGRMPERFLLQILRHLVTHGILHSTRGVDGGYSLERRPEEISLLEVIEAIDGPLAATFPPMEGGQFSVVEARLREALGQVTAACRKQLAAIKLSDLLDTSPLARLA
jgi:Rrf2 family protein